VANYYRLRVGPRKLGQRRAWCFARGLDWTKRRWKSRSRHAGLVTGVPSLHFGVSYAASRLCGGIHAFLEQMTKADFAPQRLRLAARRAT
jgi:hypothetical protein